MSKARKGWLASPNVGMAWSIVAALIWGVGLLAIYRSRVGAYLEAELARPLDFRLRDRLGRNPLISDKLKIYSVDDETFSQLKDWYLTLPQWASILKTIDGAGARAAVIDQMFSKIDIDGSQAALTTLKSLRMPVITGAFVYPTKISTREGLPLGRPEYNLKARLNPSSAALAGEIKSADAALPRIAERLGWVPYGPMKDLLPVFRMVGHISYDGDGKVAPLFRLSSDQAIPHISTLIAPRREFVQGKLLLDGVDVPLDERGEVVVNFPPARAYYEAKTNLSLIPLLRLAERGEKSTVIHADDVVLILPYMYTGNTDFRATPFGFQPGGMILAAMINSVLTGQWLKPMMGGEALTIVFASAGALLAMRAGALAFWLLLAGGVGSGFVFSEYLFAWQGVVCPWLFPLTAFVGAGVSVFAEKMRVGEKKVQALRSALEGAVAPDELKQILKRPERITFEARERIVTLVFIDVVGFSLLAEKMLPRTAFENLKKMLGVIGDMIHQEGGIIDKTLGDGLLCYFGYSFAEDSSSPDHAERALRCAIRIQDDNLKRNLAAAAAGEPVYPLRIGINTASCYLGDLGSQSRIDFTVVGNGVNFAKRLEGACDMHSVLFGATTYDLVKGIGLPPQSISKRFVRIKHHSELVEAYECDPFWADPTTRRSALDAFRKCANIERVDQRWPVLDPSKIRLACDFGDGQLVNFSHTGLSVKLKQPLARGTRLNITLDGAGGALRQMLSKEGIELLQGEVRWGYAEGAEHVHGVVITNMSDAQSDHLVRFLCEFAFARDAKTRGTGGAA